MSTHSTKNNPISPIPPDLLGTPLYYQWRHDDFLTRNPTETAPNYYLGYGFKYSQRFQNKTSKKLSTQGQKWIHEVMLNLQTSLENRLLQDDGIAFECNAQLVRDFAFLSHPEAYWNEKGEAPLYTLTIKDLFVILFAPDFRDLISVRSLRQIVVIVGKLIGFWFSRFGIRKKRGCPKREHKLHKLHKLTQK